MDDISDLAARWGVAAEYFDAFGNRKTVDRDVLGRIVGAISGGREPETRRLPSTVVLRGQNRRIEVPSDRPLRWQVLSRDGVVAEGSVENCAIALPDLEPGTYGLHVSAPDGAGSETSTLLVAPQTTFQGRDPGARWWALAVQLY